MSSDLLKNEISTKPIGELWAQARRRNRRRKVSVVVLWLLVVATLFVGIKVAASRAAWSDTALTTGTSSGLAHQGQGITTNTVQTSPGLFTTTVTVAAGIDPQCGAIGVVQAQDASGNALEISNGVNSLIPSTVRSSPTSATYTYAAPVTAVFIALGAATFCGTDLAHNPTWAMQGGASIGQVWSKSSGVWSEL